MSGPSGVRMTIISGGQRSGDIVVAAATFLSMGFLTIDCVCKDKSPRVEFLTALRHFTDHPGMHTYKSPDSYRKALAEPDHSLSTRGLFWLALDKEGERLAWDIFRANRDSPDARVYHSVRKLNLIERPFDLHRKHLSRSKCGNESNEVRKRCTLPGLNQCMKPSFPGVR